MSTKPKGTADGLTQLWSFPSTLHVSDTTQSVTSSRSQIAQSLSHPYLTGRISEPSTARLKNGETKAPFARECLFWGFSDQNLLNTPWLEVNEQDGLVPHVHSVQQKHPPHHYTTTTNLNCWTRQFGGLDQRCHVIGRLEMYYNEQLKKKEKREDNKKEYNESVYFRYESIRK